MIYFLVNNDYQLLDANRHASRLHKDRQSLTLIQVPHSLQCAPADGLYDRIETFASPMHAHRWFAAWPRYFRAWRDMQRRLKPAVGDVLVIYTEFELLNHCAVLHFSRSGAMVVHIEDGGVGTYIPFASVESQSLSLRQRLVAWMTRRLPGMGDTCFKKINGIVFPWRPDSQIDLLCVYRKFKPARQIKTEIISSEIEAKKITRTLGRVVFLNECIYDHYQDERSYLQGLDRILEALSAGYSEVFFKFHPRETEEWRERIHSQVIARFAQVQVIQESAPFELLLERYAPEALASYIATPLLNLAGTGVEPLFLFHLLEDLRDQPIFAQLTAVLLHWNYRFVSDWADVRSGYRSHIEFHDSSSSLSFADLVQSLPPVATNSR